MLRHVDRRAVFRLVLSNARLRRVVLAFAAFNLADWARWLAILIYAFERGGAAEAGAVSLLQLLPAAIVAPIAASLGDRFPRERVLLVSYVAQAVLMMGTAVTILSGMAPGVVYGLAVLGAMAITLTRPAHGSLLPWVSRTPAELTAANAASGTMEGLGILAGQATAGILIQLAGPGVALLVAGSIAGAAALAVTGLRVPHRIPARSTVPGGEPDQEIVRAGLASELAGGLAAVVRSRGPRTVVLLLGAAAAVWGALDVLVVVLALDLLDAGASSVGLFNALAGIGGLAGAAFALSLAGRVRLAIPFAVALVAWGVPLIGIGLVPLPIVVGTLLLVAGAGRTTQDVIGRTLLQRTCPDAVLARVLGVVEGMFMAAFGLGSILVPAVIVIVGPQAAFGLAGLLLPISVLIAWRSLRALDASAVVPVRELAILRGIGLFAPLGPPVLERLALHLEPLRFSPGDTIFHQGDPGDRLYIVVSGEVEIRIDDRPVGIQGPGTEFGEIALLRDVPRTATVVALTEVELLALPSQAFLTAVAGHPTSRLIADDTVRVRLGEAGP